MWRAQRRRYAMPDSDKLFAGSIPENYDRFMVPLIFESYAQDLSRRGAALAPKSVLETAAGGGFLFNVWDRIEENVFANDVTEALAMLYPDNPPRFMARTPHGYHDTALIRSDLAKAGFSDVTIETRPAMSPAPSARYVAVA